MKKSCGLPPSGFTLIELLVSIAIMILLVGGGVAAYVRLNSRQQLLRTGRTVQEYFRAAQKKARVEDKPTGCDHLLSYEVLVPSNALNQIQLIGECQNGTYPVTSYNFTFPSPVQSLASFNVHFLVLQGGVTNAGTITLIANNLQFNFTVDQGGDMSDGAVTSYP